MMLSMSAIDVTKVVGGCNMVNDGSSQPVKRLAEAMNKRGELKSLARLRVEYNRVKPSCTVAA